MRKIILTCLILLTGIIPQSHLGQEERASAADDFDIHHPDILLIGSELEGMYLARAAREEGLSVVVLDPRAKPGGQLLQGEMVYLDEPMGDNGQRMLQGRIKELFDLWKQGKIRKIDEFRSYYARLAEGIPILSGVTLTGVDIRRQPDGSARTVSSVSYRAPDGSQSVVYPRYVVENTDFAALTSQLGLRRIPGMETVFDKGGATRDYMAASMMMKFKNVDWTAFQKAVMGMDKKARAEIFGPETTVTNMFTWGFGKVGASYDSGSDEWFLRGLNTVYQRDGEATMNALLVFNADPSDDVSIRRALEAGRQQTQRVLMHFRRVLPGWSKAELNGYPEYLYIRDFDRYETEYVLQGTDLMAGRMFWDNVSIAGYEIDLQGTMSRKWGLRMGNPDKYGMPLRSFLAKGYTNVIVAGKNVGASAVAYGSARIQAHTALAAESIGVILGQMDARPGLANLSPARMKVMQDYLRTKYNIRLTDVKANNKIAHLSERDKRLFNQGKIVIP